MGHELGMIWQGMQGCTYVERTMLELHKFTYFTRTVTQVHILYALHNSHTLHILSMYLHALHDRAGEQVMERGSGLVWVMLVCRYVMVLCVVVLCRSWSGVPPVFKPYSTCVSSP